MPSQPKLSPEQVREIRQHIQIARRVAKRAGKKTLPSGWQARVAEQYGVSTRTIQHIITGDRWANVR